MVYSAAAMPNVMRRHLSEKRRGFGESEFAVQHSGAEMTMNNVSTTTNSLQHDDRQHGHQKDDNYPYYYYYYYDDYDEHAQQQSADSTSAQPSTVKPDANKTRTYDKTFLSPASLYTVYLRWAHGPSFGLLVRSVAYNLAEPCRRGRQWLALAASWTMVFVCE